MAVATERTYAEVQYPGAASPTAMLRAVEGDETDDFENRPLEVFQAVEATGIGVVERD